MDYSKIIFERVTLIQLPILIYYLLKQREINFLNYENFVKNRNWVKKLVKKGKISAIPRIGYADNECYGTALDNVEKFYKYFTGNSILVREMIKIYGDETIELAYKKELTRELSEFYYLNSYLHSRESGLGTSERILFIPYKYKMYLRLAKKSGAFYYDHQNIDIAQALNIFNCVYGFGDKVKAWLLQLGIIASYFIKSMVPGKGNGPVKKYRYAILIRDPDFQFKFKTRSVDFLFNGKKINRDNTLFILSSPAITNENREEIKSKHLNLIDCSSQFKLSHCPGKSEIANILKRTLPYAVRFIFLGLFENRSILSVNNILLLVFLHWSFILSRINIKHFITFNDEGIGHIGRNILLNKSGAKTWYYAHSGSFPHMTVSPDSNITNWRHYIWSFLHYDYYISWNNEIIEYYKLHPQKISNYLSIGCIWSQSIVDILKRRTVSKLGKKIFTNFDMDKYKTLAVFDSTYTPSLITPLEGGVIFYQCILRLLEEFSDILVIVKEKKAEETVLKIYEDFGGSSDIYYKQYKPALDELRKHPQCYVTGYKGDPAEIIAMSDLTVTLAFSSSTVEALCAGKKAIFFDPRDRWRGCRYDKIPNLVAHNYKELKCLIQKLLYETSEEEYRDFLNTYVKGVVDPYLDGKAVTRFQQLLERQL